MTQSTTISRTATRDIPTLNFIRPTAGQFTSDNPLIAFSLLDNRETNGTDLDLELERQRSFFDTLTNYVPADGNTTIVLETRWGANVITYVCFGTRFSGDATQVAELTDAPQERLSNSTEGLRAVSEFKLAMPGEGGGEPTILVDRIEQRLLLFHQDAEFSNVGSSAWAQIDVRHKKRGSAVRCSFWCPGWAYSRASFAAGIALPENADLCCERSREGWMERVEAEIKGMGVDFAGSRERARDAWAANSVVDWP